jgi:hypothetical protein
MITIIMIFFWGVAILKYGSLKSQLPVSYRVQNTLLSLYLVFSASFGWNLLLLFIFHSDVFQKYVYVQSGALSPSVTLLIVVLFMCASLLGMVIGFGMAQQKRKARILALRVIPYLAVIDVLDTIRSLSVRAEAQPDHIRLIGLFILLQTVGFYVWLYCFCRSRRTEELMANVA